MVTGDTTREIIGIVSLVIMLAFLKLMHYLTSGGPDE